MNPFDLLLAPLGYSFMVRGFLAVLMVGIVCATVGVFIVLARNGVLRRRPGARHLARSGRWLSGWRWGAPAAILVGYVGCRSWRPSESAPSAKGTRIREDTAIGVVFAGMFALGIALISTVRNYTVDLSHFLFGDVLGVSTGDLWLIAIFGGLIVLVVLLLYKEFLVLTFDPLLAVTLRLPAGLLEYLLLVLIAVAIVVSLQTVGVALMVAMLVTPAASAYLLTRRLASHDGPGRGHRFLLRSNRALRFLLRRSSFRRRDRADQHGNLSWLSGCSILLCVEREVRRPVIRLDIRGQ